MIRRMNASGRSLPSATGNHRPEAVIYSPEKSETGMGYLAYLETDLYSWRKNCGFTLQVLHVRG